VDRDFCIWVNSGLQVMPYSTGCKTPLSNFEAGQNYKVMLLLLCSSGD